METDNNDVWIRDVVIQMPRVRSRIADRLTRTLAVIADPKYRAVYWSVNKSRAHLNFLFAYLMALNKARNEWNWQQEINNRKVVSVIFYWASINREILQKPSSTSKLNWTFICFGKSVHENTFIFYNVDFFDNGKKLSLSKTFLTSIFLFWGTEIRRSW